MQEARYYTKLAGKAVQCCLCPNYCHLEDGKISSCMSRKNSDGILYAINYSQSIGLGMDPIEKKPLYHYYPGSQIFSLGANSCNLHCYFCQNFGISQMQSPTRELTPQQLLDRLVKDKRQQVAFTYSEPFTWYEYILDFARLAKEKQIRIVLITNGYVNPEPLKELLPYIDAMNIDLKGMDERFYAQNCGGKLSAVLETIKTVSQACHLEVTNLVIPGENDSETMLQLLVDFIAGIDKNIPLHFSRYFPQYKCNRPVTPDSSLQRAYQIARQKLNYVYVGNTGAQNNTVCPDCQAVLIERHIFHSRIVSLTGNTCSVCGTVIYGRF